MKILINNGHGREKVGKRSPDDRILELLYNRFCSQLGKTNVGLVSIHVSAANRGGHWYNVKGWCAYTYYGHTLSDKLAVYLYKAACKHLPEHRI